MDDPSGAGGEVSAAAKRSKAPSTGSCSSSSPAAAAATDSVDRLSALSDDLLAKILSSVSTPGAVQTVVLSKRWGSIWKLLPDLRFPSFPSPAAAAAFRDALSDDRHPLPLRDLSVEGDGGAGGLPSSVSTWLPAAARRVERRFTLHVTAAPSTDAWREDEAAGAVELPCFELATEVSIDLWFRGRLAMPAAGVFSSLTVLRLRAVRFQADAAAELGAAVSSARCPCLERLYICNTYGLERLAVSSSTLEKMEVKLVDGLRELAVDAPELEELHVVDCFAPAPPAPPEPEAEAAPPVNVIDIKAPALEVLEWRDLATQHEIWFARQLSRLRCLGNFVFFVYGDDDIFDTYNSRCLDILESFYRPVESLTLTLKFMRYIDGYEYAMEEMTVLPDHTILHLIVMSSGHCFGDSSLHVLRICTGMRKLVLELSSSPDLKEEPLTCPLGCICRQQLNWQTEELELLVLEEIEIKGFGRSDHDIGFVEQLFSWATSLTEATVFFDESVSEGVAKELCWMFQFFPVPNEVHIDFRYHNNEKVSDAPDEEQGN